MPILLLDRSLRVEIFYDETDLEFEDNICVSITEECPEDEKVFRADETNIYLTCEQADQLIQALTQAIQASHCDQEKFSSQSGGK